MSMTEPTIEECLKELREMFPRCPVIVSAFLCPNEYSIAVASEDEYELFNYPTLNECVAQVRAWKESQKDVTK